MITKEQILERLHDHNIPTKEEIINKNGIEREGIVLLGDSNISPIIYPDEYYDLDLDDAINRIIYIYNSHIDFEFDANEIKEFDSCKDRLYLCLAHNVGQERVAEPFLDMYEYVRIFINGHATVPVTKQMVKIWDIPLEEVFNIAWHNTKETIITKTVYQQLIEMGIYHIDDVVKDLYLLTANGMRFGASAMLSMETLEELRIKMNTDRLYIIPSSIHECLCVPEKDENTYEMLTAMIGEVNREELSPEDVLNHHPYIYENGTLFYLQHKEE